MSDSGKNILPFIIAIRNFLEGLDDNHLKSLLADWSPADCRTRSIEPRTLPVLSWLPEAVKAAGKKADSIVTRLAALANHVAWNQTYSADDFGAEFLERYGWAEFIGLRGPIASGEATSLRGMDPDPYCGAWMRADSSGRIITGGTLRNSSSGI